MHGKPFMIHQFERDTIEQVKRRVVFCQQNGDTGISKSKMKRKKCLFRMYNHPYITKSSNQKISGDQQLHIFVIQKLRAEKHFNWHIWLSFTIRANIQQISCTLPARNFKKVAPTSVRGLTANTISYHQLIKSCHISVGYNINPTIRYKRMLLV